MRLLALLLVLVPVLLARAGTAFADDPPGVTTTQLVYAEPIDFPPDTSLIIETGCSHCDASSAGYYRVSRTTSGPVHVDRIAVPDTDAGGVIGLAASTDGGFLASVTCFVCIGINVTPELVATRVHWSDDGGITWTLLGESRGSRFLIAVIPQGPVFRDYDDKAQTPRFIDGTPLDAAELALVSNRYLLRSQQWDDATRTLSAPDDSFIASLPYADNAPSLLSQPGHPPVVTWWQRGLPRSTPFYYYYTTPAADGTQTGVHTQPFALLHGWLDDYVLGSFDAADGNVSKGMSVGLLDLQRGTVYPIGAPFGERPLVGRNFVTQALRGPFWRVPAPDCLPLRAWADEYASQVSCAAPNVLLRPTGNLRYERAVEWREVSLPNGTTGWVPRSAVEE